MNKYVEQYSKENFYCFTFEGITTKQKEDGTIEKKSVGFPKWKTIDQTNFNQHCFNHHRALAIITGKMSNITGFDFDNADEYHRLVNEHPELKKCRTIKTRKGYHIYFKYNENVSSTTNAMMSYKSVDIRNDNAILYAPPTKYKLPDGTICEYVNLGGEIIDIPDYLLQDLKQNQKKNIQQPLITKFKVKEEDENDITDKDETDEEELMDKEKTIEKLLKIISSDRASSGSYSQWVQIGQVIKNELNGKGLVLFTNWTNENGTPNKKKECYEKYTNQIKFTPKNRKERLSIGSLHYWAKNDNPVEYEKVFGKTKISSDIPQHVEELIEHKGTEYSIATAIKTMYGENHKCTSIKDKNWYVFENQIWKFDELGNSMRNLISTNFYKYLDKSIKPIYKKSIEKAREDEISLWKEKSSILQSILMKCQKTTDKNNILRELMEISLDADFTKKINRKKYVLPIMNGNLFHLETNQVTKRTIEDIFTFECQVNYPPEVKNEKVEKYFNDLFCGNKETIQCVLDILKSSFTGIPLRYIFFCTGNGCNGKSVFFEILNEIFGSFMDIISKLVIIQQKGNFTSILNTEFEKLDKCRIGYVTELTKEDVLNMANVKAISGGDKLNLRGMQKTDTTITPTCNLFALTNELPKIPFKNNETDKSIKDRIVVIPFNNSFPANNNFKEEMLELKDEIFSYIMNNGKIIAGTIELSEEMKYAKTNYEEEHSVDYLKEFIHSYLEPCENDKVNKPIPKDELKNRYYDYCKQNHYKIENFATATAFTKRLKGLGLEVKESNHAVKIYSLKWKIDEDEDTEEEEILKKHLH